MSEYTIRIVRGRKEGTLSFTHTADCIHTTCWWDPERKIPSGYYTGCSATRMRTKLNSKGERREAIYIPNVPGYTGIFIHMGKDASWSDGCIVIPEPTMLRLYAAISPKDARNVTVMIEG